MKRLITLSLFFAIVSCIPLRIPPKIDTHKIKTGKKFKRHLLKQTAFIFKDPKEAEEFYNYINTKFQLEHKDVGLNTPFTYNNKNYSLTYHEVEKPEKWFNLFGFMIDTSLDTNVFEDNYIARSEYWYLALFVRDENNKDCLSEHHEMRNDIIKYLDNLRLEYINTHNYEELLLTDKP